MAYISQSSIQEVSDHLDAIRVASDYVHLEKRGGRYWACCPFHQEKTASFTVDPELKTYYCFGCHKGGSMINFVMEMDKLTFPEAIELLAKKSSVDIVYDNSQPGNYSADDEAKKKQKDELFELYQRISGTFQHFFLKKPESESAKLYVISRGISIEMAEKFRLGYSPADRFWLYRFLIEKGYSARFLASSGLFSGKRPEVSLFSGRLMFPIADRQGRVIAFGGRLLAEEQNAPKYINSPEIGIYKKGETLFAVDIALEEIRRTKTVYIAEGYMDVIALHQAGIHNAVAPLGTAFTTEQAKLLGRWAEKAIFFLDSDEAGQAAAVKSILTCRKNGLTSAVVVQDPADIVQSAAAGESYRSENAGQISPPAPAKDPADILKNSGPEALQKKAKYFINDFDYLLEKAKSLANLRASDSAASAGSSIRGKEKAVAFMFPYIDLMESEVARNSCIDAVADYFNLLPDAVAGDYRRHHGEALKEEPRPRSSGGRIDSPIQSNEELSLLIVVALDYVSPKSEKLFPGFRAALEINEIENPEAKEIFIALEECLRYNQNSMDDLLFRLSSPELRKIILKRSLTGEFSVNAEQYTADGIKTIKRKRLEKRQNEIIVKLRMLKKNAPEKTAFGGEAEFEAKELLAEKMRIDNELNSLK